MLMISYLFEDLLQKTVFQSATVA